MLKKTRVALAIISILAVTALFTDFTGTSGSLWAWMAKIQLIPALLSGGVIAVAVIVAATLVLGRVYCSVICPLGIFQDIIIRLRSIIGSKSRSRNRFNYKKAATKCRISVLILFVILIVMGLTNVACAALAGLIEPYSSYGRMAYAFAVPVWDFFNNLLAMKSESYDYYMVYRTSSYVILAVAAATLAVISLMAWFTGRDYCNKICPVGTVLGYLSRFSLLKPMIDTSKCNGCTKCARNCKASCIDAKHHSIDYSRCVACFDCLNNCSQHAISYGLRRKATAPAAPAADRKESVDASRRSFLTTAGVIAGALAVKAAEKTTDGGLTPLRTKRKLVRATAVVPAGALSLANLTEHCTACQLCVSACPNNVLSPSTSIENFMQPQMNFTQGYCRPECNRCSEVCPSGAITPIDLIEKSSTQIGRAVVDASLCISATEGIHCGNCARHCPAQAITMVETAGEGSNLRPAVDETRCIGCGSCEYHCPVGSVDSTKGDTPAIHVEGIEVHHTI